jgi:hypothetical protein
MSNKLKIQQDLNPEQKELWSLIPHSRENVDPPYSHEEYDASPRPLEDQG